MNKIYIVEGLDRCGKSTIISELRKKLTNPRTLTLHSNKPPAGVDARSWSIRHYNALVMTIRNLWVEGFDIILDRSWIGEAVYAPLYRGGSPEDRWMFELEQNVLFNAPGEGWYNRSMVFKTRTPIVELILCIDSPSNMMSRDDGLGMTSEIEQVEKERLLFIAAYSLSNIKYKTFVDWEVEKFDNRTIQNIINKVTSDYTETGELKC